MQMPMLTECPGGGDCDESSSRHHGYVSFYLHLERGASKSTSSETYFRPVQARGLSGLRFLGGCLSTQALLLRPEIGSKLGTEVLCLEHPANLNLGFPFMRTGAAFDPLDCLFHRSHLPQPEAGDQLLGLGEGPVDDSPFLSREPDALALRTRVEPLGGEQHASFHQLFVFQFALRPGFPDGLDGMKRTSSLSSNDGQFYRQVRYIFWKYLLRVRETKRLIVGRPSMPSQQ